MNAGEWPEGMSAERRKLIATLEELGFEGEGATDWRDRMSNADLKAAVATLDCVVAFVDDDGGFKVEGEDGTVTVIDAADDEAEFPDISELVAAIDEVVAARDAFLASTTPATTIECGLRQGRAFDRCRELQKQIARAQEAAFHA